MEYDKMTQTPIENLLALHDNKMKVSTIKSSSASLTKSMIAPTGSYMGTDEVKQSTKIAILEAKEKQLNRWLDMY